MENEKVLAEIGFTPGEIKVYYALFDLGETTVGPISKKSGVTHAKVYPILEKLITKGLVTHTIRDGRQNFSATNPNNLLEFIEDKLRNLQEEKDRVKKIIPRLLERQKTKEETQYSRVFEGTRGLRALFYELFNQGAEKEILVFGLNELLEKPSFINFFAFYHDLRKKNKIKLRLLLDKGAEKIIKKEYFPGKMYAKTDKIKYTNKEFPTGVFIFENHVISIVSEDNITAFDIKSKQNAERYKKFFEGIWERA